VPVNPWVYRPTLLCVFLGAIIVSKLRRIGLYFYACNSGFATALWFAWFILLGARCMPLVPIVYQTPPISRPCVPVHSVIVTVVVSQFFLASVRSPFFMWFAWYSLTDPYVLTGSS
jgi:hypothetical protein